MNTQVPGTETIIRHHLQAFLEGQGLEAVVKDYDDDARFYSESQIHRGKKEIGAFFEDFVRNLPPDAFDHFELKSLLVEEDVGYITWNVGRDIPLGTDTFVVAGGKIVAQTFAMYAVPPR